MHPPCTGLIFIPAQEFLLFYLARQSTNYIVHTLYFYIYPRIDYKN